MSTRIRVPSCSKCNNGRSREDEEFRIALGLLAGKSTPSLKRLWRKAIRTMDHSPALRRKFATLVFKDERGRSAITLPKTLVNSAIERVVYGLHWHHYKERVQPTVTFDIFKLEQPAFDQMCNELRRDLIASHVGFDQFQYWHGRAVDQPTASLWLFSFYRRVFFAATLDDRSIDSDEQ